MSVQPVPAGFHTITPYLIIKDAEKVIAFLKSAFGAEVKTLHGAPGGLVMHASLRIGNSMLMLSDARDPWPAMPAGFYLYVPNVDEVYQRALAAGAESINPPRDEFYGDRMAGVRDSSGNVWWIATHIEDVSEEEQRRRMEKMFDKKP